MIAYKAAEVIMKNILFALFLTCTYVGQANASDINLSCKTRDNKLALVSIERNSILSDKVYFRQINNEEKFVFDSDSVPQGRATVIVSGLNYDSRVGYSDIISLLNEKELSQLNQIPDGTSFLELKNLKTSYFNSNVRGKILFIEKDLMYGSQKGLILFRTLRHEAFGNFEKRAVHNDLYNCSIL